MHKNHRKRMREDFERSGIMGWQDHKVLEFLLFYAIPRRDTNDTAHALIEKCGGLSNVFEAPVEQLMSVDGVGRSSADFLRLVGQCMRYIDYKNFMDEPFVLDSKRCERYLINLFRNKSNEYFYMLCLDAQNRIIYQDMLFEGGLENTEIDAVKVVRQAVNCGAVCVVFAHNHPSGVARPSYSDVETTRALEEKLRVVGILLLDHIIVAQGKCASMRKLKCLVAPMEKLKKKYSEEQ